MSEEKKIYLFSLSHEKEDLKIIDSIYNGSVYNLPQDIIDKITNINIGDKVEYIDAEMQMIDKHYKTVKVKKQGIWDGTKVELNDKEKTIVRNKLWLRKENEEKSIWDLLMPYEFVIIS